MDSVSHRPGSRLLLLSTSPAVTSVAFIRWRHPYTHPISAYYSFIDPDNGHPLDAGQVQGKESWLARDRHSTTVPHNQPLAPVP